MGSTVWKENSVCSRTIWKSSVFLSIHRRDVPPALKATHSLQRVTSNSSEARIITKVNDLKLSLRLFTECSKIFFV